VRRSFKLRVYAYVIMPEHVHLLLSEPGRGTLADALKSLKQGVSRRLIGDAEHFWQKRYYDFNVRNYPQFVEKLRYIHRNPVKKDLCQRPEDWAWSSFRHYATGYEGRVEIESDWTARKRERATGKLCPTVPLPHPSGPKILKLDKPQPEANAFCCDSHFSQKRREKVTRLRPNHDVVKKCFHVRNRTRCRRTVWGQVINA